MALFMGKHFLSTPLPSTQKTQKWENDSIM